MYYKKCLFITIYYIIMNQYFFLMYYYKNFCSYLAYLQGIKYTPLLDSEYYMFIFVLFFV